MCIYNMLLQTTTFGIHRMDYMVDAKTEPSNESGIEIELKQVEINTISAANFAHSLHVSQLHKFCTCILYTFYNNYYVGIFLNAIYLQVKSQ